MANSVTLEIITPSKLFYRGEVEMLIVKTVTGEEGFMAGHSWACKLLTAGRLRFKEVGAKDFKVAAVAGGFVDVRDTFVVFTDAAEWPEEIDIERALEVKRLAEEWLKNPSDDDNEIEIAKFALIKAINRIKIGESEGRSGR
ncbi:MAG: ATP synthase F1 subunit epsilon [Anaerovoracaceae bacterium]|jgi:F-type H+-transporting ATPase subunit epsilon